MNNSMSLLQCLCCCCGNTYEYVRAVISSTLVYLRLLTDSLEQRRAGADNEKRLQFEAGLHFFTPLRFTLLPSVSEIVPRNVWAVCVNTRQTADRLLLMTRVCFQSSREGPGLSRRSDMLCWFTVACGFVQSRSTQRDWAVIHFCLSL